MKWISVVGWGQLLAVLHVWLSAVSSGNRQQSPLPHHPGYRHSGICRGNAVASDRFTRLQGEATLGLFSSQPAGSRRDWTILDLPSDTSLPRTTWPWCPCPQLRLELDYLKGVFQHKPFKFSDSVPYWYPAKLVLCLGTPDLVELHLKLHLHLVRL